MGDHQTGAVLQHSRKRGLHRVFRFRVHAGSGLVEHQHPGPPRHDPRDADQLPLPLREAAAALAERGIEPLGQEARPIQDFRGLGGAAGAFLADSGVAEADVVEHAAGEEMHILLHHGELAAQLFHRPLLHIEPVHEHRAALHIVETQQQRRERRLARPGVSDERHRFARLDAQLDVPQHPVVRVVGEGDAVQAQRAVPMDRGARLRRGSDRRFGVQQAHDPLRSRHRALQDVELLRQIADGPEEHLRIHQERDQPAHGERSGIYPGSPVTDDDGDGDRGDQLHDRVEDGEAEHRLQVRAGVLAVQLPVFARPAAFLPEQLQHLDPGQRLLEETVHRRDRGAHPAKRRPDAPPEDPAGGEERRHRPEGDERQLPVHEQQRRHDADQQHHIGDDHDDAGTQQFVQGVHIAGGAGHHLAHRIPVEPVGVEFLDVVEHIPADVAHHALPEQVHDPGLSVGGDEPERQHRRVEPEDAGEPGDVAGGDVVVDRDPRQVRPGELRPGVHQDQTHAQRHELPVGKQVRQHPAEEFPVAGPLLRPVRPVRLDRPVRLGPGGSLFRGHSRDNSSSSICRRYIAA